MNFFHKSILALSCLALFGLQGCTTKSDDGKNPLVNHDVDEDKWDNLTYAQQELYFNGWLLSVYYVNADKELEDFDYYDGKGVKNGYPTKYYEFPDVSYMYSTLSDNFTNYFSPMYAEQIFNALTYSEEKLDLGVDVEEVTVPDCEGEESCEKTKSVLVFKHVYPEAPAAKAGIKKGDTLISVDGIEIQYESAFQKLSSGDANEKINIAVKRGDEELSFKALLEAYLAPSVFVDTEDGIPVITITEFIDTTYLNTGTYGEFMDALKETEGAEATIIDLRGNPGGSVDQCMDMTAELLSKNDTMAFMVTHEPDTNTLELIVDTLVWTASENGLGKDRYYVFLADSGSASCAELMLVGATSNTKSPVVGLTTYGKGIGQSYVGTYAGGIAGITSMRMIDKNGKIYHRYGIEPDYVEGDPDEAMAIAVELAKEKKAVRTKEYGSKDTGHFTLAKSRASSKAPERGGAYKVIRKKLQKPFPFK